MREYRRDLKRFAAIREYRLGGVDFEWIPCAYCGLPSTEREHVLPSSFTQALSDMEEVIPVRLYLVPSCRECNTLAHNYVFKNITQKRRYIHDRIRRRYKKLLRMPIWTESDLEELSPDLVRYVHRGLQFKEIILSRLTWPRGNSPAVSAVVASNPLAPLKCSASGNVELPSIMQKSTQRGKGSSATRKACMVQRRPKDLSDEEVRIIRARLRHGAGITATSKAFKVSRGTILRILNNEGRFKSRSVGWLTK